MVRSEEEAAAAAEEEEAAAAAGAVGAAELDCHMIHCTQTRFLERGKKSAPTASS
jgi:hypothetical protein